MVLLCGKDRIEILRTIGFGHPVRTPEEVCSIFNVLHPESKSISRSTVCKNGKKLPNLEDRSLQRTKLLEKILQWI